MELPGNANRLFLGSLFRDQSKPWEEIARLYLMNAWESVKCFVSLLLHNLMNGQIYSSLVGAVLAGELEKMKGDMINELEELTVFTKQGDPLPLGKSFFSRIQRA
jgi:hypothetical protein